jgi:hypothetical protein
VGFGRGSGLRSGWSLQTHEPERWPEAEGTPPERKVRAPLTAPGSSPRACRVRGRHLRSEPSPAAEAGSVHEGPTRDAMTSSSAHSAYLGCTVAEFLQLSPNEVLGRLVGGDSFSNLEAEQRWAWRDEIEILRTALQGLSGWIYLEFDVPRLGSRIDAVLVSGPAVFPIEFKVGETRFTLGAHNQTWDYGLDLKNFHGASHDAPIFPILVATAANSVDSAWATAHEDGVRPPRRANTEALASAIQDGLAAVAGSPQIDGEAWGAAPYHPTPTILEAARALYSRHTVEAITRNDAGATNLRITSAAVEEIIDAARERKEKAIVFLTGVPGAGKTLVGLNVATRRRDLGDARAVFLSGNGPLVAVLQEALTRDEYERNQRAIRKGLIRQRVKPFIQNVHHFRDEGVRSPEAPHDHVVIFDEAQRAWDREKTADFMKRRKKLPNFAHSESEFLVSYLERHPEWAVVICLVGGGQEIHTGEAGIAAWLEAIHDHFPGWRTYISGSLHDAEYAAGGSIEALARRGQLTYDSRLHLATSMRSFRTEKVSAFVKALLDEDVEAARELHAQVAERYPIVVTRDLDRAKDWVRYRSRGSERCGLLASSQAQRLKPHAIDVRVNVDPIQWFLADRTDTRSSYYLEDAATEFQVQGLEVDWACVTWDADLRRGSASWSYHSFRGDAWTTIRKPDRQRYLLNAYRVLLTRARQGMAVFVPRGEPSDPTRDPKLYDRTFAFLLSTGMEEI